MTLNKGEKMIKVTKFTPASEGANCPGCALNGSKNPLLVSVKEQRLFCRNMHRYTFAQLANVYGISTI